MSKATFMAVRPIDAPRGTPGHVVEVEVDRAPAQFLTPDGAIIEMPASMAANTAERYMPLPRPYWEQHPVGPTPGAEAAKPSARTAMRRLGVEALKQAAADVANAMKRPRTITPMAPRPLYPGEEVRDEFRNAFGELIQITTKGVRMVPTSEQQAPRSVRRPV